MPRVARRPTPARGGRSAGALAVSTALVLVATLGAPSAAAQEGGDGGGDVVAVAQRDGEAWLAGAQRDDGGYALAGLEGVETPEAVLALAGQAQTEDVWSDREAIDGVEALGAGNAGPDVFAALSRLARSTRSPTDAAILITRVALPLGLDPTAFDPANEGQPVDLVTLLDAATPDDSVVALSEVVTARVAVGEEVPRALVAAIVDGRRADGAWGGPDGTEDLDVSRTASAIVALIAAGVPATDERVAPALRSLAAAQADDGGWGRDDRSAPVDTAAAMGALRAAGFDPDDVCWQQELLDRPTARPTPADHLIDIQAADGHWGSAGEALSTAAALQALQGGWAPITRAESRNCGNGFDWPLPAVPPALVIIVGIGLIGMLGATRILRDGQSGL